MLIQYNRYDEQKKLQLMFLQDNENLWFLITFFLTSSLMIDPICSATFRSGEFPGQIRLHLDR